MVFEGSSDIIHSVQPIAIRGAYAEMLQLHNGNALAIDQKSIALFKHHTDIHDELGNGLICMSELPPSHYFNPKQTPWVDQHRAGFVGFTNGAALIILPNTIRLFGSKTDALHNTGVIAELNFS